MKIWSKENQYQRRQAVQALHRDYAYANYGEDGRFTKSETNDWRHYFWDALSLFNGEEKHIHRANAMIRFGAPLGNDDFWTSAVCSLLARFNDKITPEIDELLRTRLDTFMEHCLGTRYKGNNDNFPSMAVLSLEVGAYLVNRPEYAEKGMESLYNLKRMLTRRGYLSEFASPTYSPISLACLAEIVNLSPNKEAVNLALSAEERIWTELCSHFHIGTSFLAGPHSRAYIVDQCAHPHTAHVIFYQVFGDNVFINPLNSIFPYRKGQVLHNQDEHIAAHAAWQTTPDYHVPDYAAELALNKRYPFEAFGSSEKCCYYRNWYQPQRHAQTPIYEIPATEIHSHTYMEEDFAVGSSSHAFGGGTQGTVFHLTYRKRKNAHNIEDIATVFPRFLLNDRKVNKKEFAPDLGHAFGVSKGNVSMTLYNGRTSWNYGGHAFEFELITAIKLYLNITCFYGLPDEIWMGEKKCTGFTGENTEPVSIFIKDGPIYMAFHPLIYTNYGRKAAVRLTENDGFGIIEFVNYEDTVGRVFKEEELYSALNGFVSIISEADSWDNFKSFRDSFINDRITDDFRVPPFMRETVYNGRNVKLAMEMSPFSSGIKYRTVDDRLPNESAFEASGFDNQNLNWLSK